MVRKTRIGDTIYEISDVFYRIIDGVMCAGVNVRWYARRKRK